MATKYLLQNLEGETLKTTSKKQTAIDAAHKESLLRFRVVTDKGSVVYEEVPEAPEAEDLIGDVPTENPVSEQPEPVADEVVDEAAEPLFYEFLDFPGNYSIVTAPMAVEIAEAAGVPTKVETFAGKLTRRVHFGGTDMDLAARTTSLVQETVAKALEDLHTWQKANIERRRGLTDMQRYVEHREFIAKAGTKVAKQVKKQGV